MFMLLYNEGIRDAAEIARRSGIDRRTASNYMRRALRGESLDDRPRSGRPRALTQVHVNTLRQIAREHPGSNTHFYAQQLAQRAGIRVSAETVRKALHRRGFSYRHPKRRVVTSSQKAERVAFARVRLRDSWDMRISCDEAYFNLNRLKNKRWIEVGHEEEAGPPKLTASQEKISIGTVAAVMRGRKLPLAFLPKNWNGGDLTRIFDRVLLPSLGRSVRSRNQYEWMMDNDGRHHQQSWLTFAERMGLRIISPWPSNSPDLQPIENQFSWMKRRVENLAPSTKLELRAAIEQAWAELPLEHVNNSFESMPRRLRAVLRLHGARTKY